MERQEFDPSLSRARFSGEMGSDWRRKKKVDRERCWIFFCFVFLRKMYSSISSLSHSSDWEKEKKNPSLLLALRAESFPPISLLLSNKENWKPSREIIHIFLICIRENKVYSSPFPNCLSRQTSSWPGKLAFQVRTKHLHCFPCHFLGATR